MPNKTPEIFVQQDSVETYHPEECPYEICRDREYGRDICRIGFLGDKEVIVIRDDPATIPSFHVIDIATRGKSCHYCISILSADYIDIESAGDVIGTEHRLTVDERTTLVRFLNDKSSTTKFCDFTNWELILVMWNLNNQNNQVESDVSKPDYSKLPSGIIEVAETSE